MTKKPEWTSFTKAELIKTIKKLDKRQTQLLNELAAEKRKAIKPVTVAESYGVGCATVRTPEEWKPEADKSQLRFPWEGSLPNAFEGKK